MPCLRSVRPPRSQIQAGANYLSFTDDPFDSSSSDAVIEVDYEQGSFGGDGKGGAQFYVRPLFPFPAFVVRR